jgi:hypothetical protein
MMNRLPFVPPHLARKAVVFQPNAEICLAVLLDDVTWCLKTLWEMCVMHVAAKHLEPRSLRTEAVPLSVITSTLARVMHVVH